MNNVVYMDVESTGIAPKSRLLSIALVAETDFARPFQTLPAFHAVVDVRDRNGMVTGEPMALAMNGPALRAIAKGGGKCETWVRDAAEKWAAATLKPGPIVLAGKNVWKADLRWLESSEVSWGWLFSRLHHRSIDPGPMYLQHTDVVPPSLDVCYERATGEPSPRGETHDPYEDCRLVRECVRRKMA